MSPGLARPLDTNEVNGQGSTTRPLQSYKLTIYHILVVYNDKQFNQTNQHKLNTDLIIK
jgi:hypothetical protein